MVAFHKGIVSYLRMKLQMAGIRAEDTDLQRFLAGVSSFRGKIAHVAYDLADEAFQNRFDLMRAWEEENPNQTPYPPLFAEVVLSELRQIDTADPGPTIANLIQLAEQELIF